MSLVRQPWWTVGLPLFAGALGITLLAASAATANPVHPGTDAVMTIVVSLPSVVLGLLLVARRPDSPSGPALLILGAAPLLTTGIESWGGSSQTAGPWPGAQIGAALQPGVWVFNLAGFILLCLVFPDGPLQGRRWRAMPWLFVAAALGVEVALADRPVGFGVVVAVCALLLLLVVLGAAVTAPFLRYRHGDETTRQQLRWLVLGAGSVPVLLVAGWVAQGLGASASVAYLGFLLAMLVVIPVTVTVAILHHDLLDVDRLLSDSVAWMLTTVAAAAIFASVVFCGAEIVGRGSRLGITGAGFITALCLVPLHRWLHDLAGRAFDRERTVALVAMQEFVHQVRDGQARPEEVEDMLRKCLDDTSLRVALRLPDADGYVDLDGDPCPLGPAELTLPLTSGDSVIGAVILGRSSARRLRRARELSIQAGLPLEVSRLRMGLRQALEDAQASRSRLVQVAAEERRRLERDLHDGAQQQVLAVGMRLRSAQRRHPPGDPTHQDLEIAVAALEATVAELRRLAHGVRPSRLDDGLEAAIRALVSESPIPVEVCIGDIGASEAHVTTTYFIVAEGLANTLKHSRAASARVVVACRGGSLAIEVSDDGLGGARPGFGLTTLADRVTALGGRVEILSPAGQGTTIRAVI